MIQNFVKLEWKQFFRSSYWQKSIAINILLIFVALYFIAVFFALGISLFPLLKKEYPDQDPLKIVNNALFYWLMADFMIRFFFQKLPVMNIKPLLVLPIKKNKIIHYVLGKSVFSFFNFLPLFAIIPFGLMLIHEGYDQSMAISWMILIFLFGLIINFKNFIVESKFSQTELSFLPVLLVVSIMYALNYFNIISFSKIISVFINWIVSNPLLLFVPIVIIGILYWMNFIILKNQLYIDQSVSSKSDSIKTSDLSWTNRFGDSSPFLQLDLRLIWRNKRSRSSVFILLIGLFYGLIFYPNPVYKEMVPFYVFIGIFVTGIFMINFGQFIPAWDSSYYKLLMSQNIKYQEYLKSKYLLMVMSAIILFVLSIPYVYFGWKILLFHFVAMVYNIGVNVYVLLYAGSFNRKKINLDQRAAFNYQGTGAVQWLLGIPLMLIPVVIFYIPYKFLNFESGIAILLIMGIIGIALHQKIMNAIVNKYIDSKYEMINAFDQND